MSIKPTAHCDPGDCAWVEDGVDAIRCQLGVWYVAQVRWGGAAWISTVYRCTEQLQDTMDDPMPLPDKVLVRLDEVVYNGSAYSTVPTTRGSSLATVPTEAVVHIPLEDVATLICHPNDDVREAALRRLAEGK